MNLLVYLLIILFTIIILIFAVSFLLSYYKNSKNKFEIIENNPILNTSDYNQHVRRLNKFRSSNYKGIMYYFSKKGGLYYYTNNNVRIYV